MTMLLPLRRTLALLGTALLLTTGAAGPARAADDAGAAHWQVLELGAPPAAYPFALYGNRRLDSEEFAGITQAVVIQHGLGRNGNAYYAAAGKLMAGLNVSPAHTLLLAPQFFATADAAKARHAGMPVWTRGGWLNGEDAIGAGLSVSSLQVYDDLLRWLADRKRFPVLKRIVLAGHSAGAQLVHRYAVLNRMDERLRSKGYSVRYVIANPSSYLYFTDERPSGESFAPYDRSACPGFNDYKYGFDKLIPYAAGEAPRAAFVRYAARDVIYLLGSNDTNPNHRLLDKRCAAEAQGADRLQRGLDYLRYERYLAGTAVRLDHRAYEVMGVGHSQSRMLGSTCGARVLFDSGESQAAGSAQCVAIPMH